MTVELTSLLQQAEQSNKLPFTTTSTLATVTTNDANHMPFSIRDRLYRQSAFPSQSLATNDLFLLYNSYGGGAHVSRVWCQSNNRDYCPLVISFMLLVIFLSLLFILCLCYSKEIVKPDWVVRALGFIRRKLRIKSSRPSLGNSRTSINSVYESTIVIDDQNLDQNRVEDASRPNSFFNRLNNFSFMSYSTFGNVWFTDISKYHSGLENGLPPPPPSYEESQLMISITKPISSFNRVIRTYPRKLSNKRPIIKSGADSSRVNTGFLVEGTDSNNQRVEPQVSCISVTVDQPCTSSSLTEHSQMTLERIGRRLLEQNQHRIRQDDQLASEVDIPPAYETVISENGIKRIQASSSASASREYVI
jgi:hypothetical protein